MRRVLVIDDEPDVLLLCRVNLAHAGHEVLEAADGPSGVRMALEHRPDVVVLDLMLPGMDGVGVLERLRGDARTMAIPVLMLTAKTQHEDRERCRDAGASAYVTKPFSPLRLTELVGQLGTSDPDELEALAEAPEMLRAVSA